MIILPECKRERLIAGLRLLETMAFESTDASFDPIAAAAAQDESEEWAELRKLVEGPDNSIRQNGQVS